MTKIICDAVLMEKLHDLAGPLELCDDPLDLEFHGILVDFFDRSCGITQNVIREKIKAGRQCFTFNVQAVFRQGMHKFRGDECRDIDSIGHLEVGFLSRGLNDPYEISGPAFGLEFGINFGVKHNDPSP